jgi:hypothetical protein
MPAYGNELWRSCGVRAPIRGRWWYARYEAAGALERIERVERRKAQLPQKTGEPWSEDEDRKLLAAFDAGRALQELAAAHERTMGAVRARLLKYGRINA